MSDFHLEQRKQGWYGISRWCKEDVHSYRKDMELHQWTDEIAEAWLASIERTLRDRMTETGWEVIETLMPNDEYVYIEADQILDKESHPDNCDEMCPDYMETGKFCGTEKVEVN